MNLYFFSLVVEYIIGFFNKKRQASTNPEDLPSTFIVITYGF